MDQAEIKCCFRGKLQSSERHKIGIIVAIDRNRHMKPIQPPFEQRYEAIGVVHHHRGVLRLNRVPSTRIAVAKMDAQIHVPGMLCARSRNHLSMFVQ